MTKTRTKVRLLIEAEVDDAEGFTKQELGKVAVGTLLKRLVLFADDFTEGGFVVGLADGYVVYGIPKAIDDGEGQISQD